MAEKVKKHDKETLTYIYMIKARQYEYHHTAFDHSI